MKDDHDRLSVLDLYGHTANIASRIAKVLKFELVDE